MGSKAPIARNSPEEGRAEESHFGGADVLKASAKNQLVGRIAEALKVSLSELYNPPNAIAPARGAGINDQLSTGLDQDCEALLQAYRRVSDPAERQRLLTLVQAAAERS